MKKIISLLLAVLLVFTLVACNAEISVEDYKVIQDEIRTEIKEEFDQKLQDEINRLEPEVITNTVYEKTEYITVYEPRDPTDSEWKAIRDDVIEEVRAEVTKDNDEWLSVEKDKLEPIEIEVIKEVEVAIEGDTYEKSFITCVVFPKEGDPILLSNLTAKKTLTGALFTGSYRITLEEALPNGTKELEYNKGTYTVCYQTFGEKIEGWDSLYPNFIPVVAPKKDE